jgi:hypothetical protein
MRIKPGLVLLVLLLCATSVRAQNDFEPPVLDFRNYDVPSAEEGAGYSSNRDRQLQSPTPLVVTMNVTPQNPRPGSRVRMEVVTFSTDLTQAEIGWYENDELIRSGVGLTTHEIVAGPAGSHTLVRVVIRSKEGFVHEEYLDIRPAVVDIMWQARSTVPPFYKGKALYTILGTIKITAFPYIVDDQGNVLDPKSLNYKWILNRRVEGNRSGMGKRSIVFTQEDSIYRTPFEIEVVVSDTSNRYFAEARTEIDVGDSSVIFYENNPVFGILFNHALYGKYGLKEKELALEAFPFYLDAPDRRDRYLRYEWTVNQDTVTKYADPTLTLRNENNESGQTDINLEVYNERKILEGAREGLTIFFGESARNVRSR